MAVNSQLKNTILNNLINIKVVFLRNEDLRNPMKVTRLIFNLNTSYKFKHKLICGSYYNSYQSLYL